VPVVATVGLEDARGGVTAEAIGGGGTQQENVDPMANRTDRALAPSHIDRLRRQQHSDSIADGLRRLQEGDPQQPTRPVGKGQLAQDAVAYEHLEAAGNVSTASEKQEVQADVSRLLRALQLEGLVSLPPTAAVATPAALLPTGPNDGFQMPLFELNLDEEHATIGDDIDDYVHYVPRRLDVTAQAGGMGRSGGSAHIALDLDAAKEENITAEHPRGVPVLATSGGKDYPGVVPTMDLDSQREDC
jgi:hypothetical protein